MKRTVRTLLLVGAIALTFGCKSGKKTTDAQASVQNEIQKVEVAQAVTEDVPAEDTYSSTVEAFATNNIAPQGASRIQRIYVEVGDMVHAGQVVAEMDRVQLNQARLQLVNDSTEYSRLKGLYDEGGVSKSDLDAMALQYNVRRSAYRNILENTVLRSPVSGVITARNYDRGDMYSMGQPIYTVEQIVPVKLLVGVSETDYSKVKRGDAVKITADALPGKEFTGKVNRIYPTINPTTHTVSVEVLVGNSDKQLRPGMYAKVTVTFGHSKSIVAPDRAVVKQEGSGQRFVYLLNADNTVTYKQITPGRHIGDKFQILDGLKEGDTVVTKGQTGLKDGAKADVSR